MRRLFQHSYTTKISPPLGEGGKQNELPKEIKQVVQKQTVGPDNAQFGDGGKVKVPETPTEIKPALKSEPTEIELIEELFTPAKKGDEGAEPMTATFILQNLSIETLGGFKINPQNIGKALKKLGFERVTERIGEEKLPRKVYWVKIT